MTSEATAMTLIKEKDYGTKHVHAVNNKMVTLEIDGQEVTVPEGTSIMRAAADLGIMVPKLCATDSLDPFGSCRLCLVEIEGRRGTPASCTTPVAPGIKVATQNDRLARIRKGVMELYISDHPLDCLTCAANGDCELQDMAGAVGLRDVRYGYDGENHVFARSERRSQSAVAGEGHVEPLLPVRAVEVHRLLALRPRLRRGAGHVRADHRRSRLCLARLRQHGRRLPFVRVRLLRRLRAGLPDRDADREVGRRARPARAQRRHHLRLLRRRLLVQGRDAGRARRAHGPLQGRRRQRGPLVRQGPLRVRLRHA